MNKPGFVRTDERTSAIIQKACSVLYALTMAALWIALVVRQFILGLPVRGYDDLAMIFTVNVLLFIGAVIYFGGVIIPRVRPARLAQIYVCAVILGTAFTVVRKQLTSLSSVLESTKIVASILGIMVAVYAILAFLGSRRIERGISD